MLSDELIERFWARTRVCCHGRECIDCCWPWGNTKRYGMLVVAGRTIIATHLAVEIATGYVFWIGVYPRYVAMHTCDNPPCVNYHHLVVGTHKQNTLDAIRKGRWWHQRRKDAP